MIEGGQENLDWTMGVLANKYLVKVRSILGPDDKVAEILKLFRYLRGAAVSGPGNPPMEAASCETVLA